jgi:y4mF family transcriptional regulator
MKLSEFLKKKRKDLGITQLQLAERSGVGIRFVREIEGGKKTLQMDKVNQVLSLFGKELGLVDMDRNSLGNEER